MRFRKNELDFIERGPIIVDIVTKKEMENK